MPAVIALLIRSLIQLGVTAAIYNTAEEFIKVTLTALPKLLQKIFNIPEQDVIDFLHDFMIEQALAFGITALALRKQLPTYVAEKLGFTSKGFTKLGITKIAKTGMEKAVKAALPAQLLQARGLWGIIFKFMGAVTTVWMMTASIEVFAYRGQFFANIADFFGLGKIVRKILISPPKPLFSDDEISSLTKGFISTYGAGVSDVELLMSVRVNENYIRDLLEMATQEIWADAKTPTQANVLKAYREIVIPRALGKTAIAASTSKIELEKPTVATTKLFIGVVSQGLLGEKTNFEARQDDMIEDTEELQQAAITNIAEFVKTLPGRIVYEIKIVSSVITSDGTKITGQPVQILSGYDSKGAAKYKTVYTKFATLTLYFFTQKNTRTKLASLTLGPVNAGLLSLKAIDLQTIETSIKENISTSNISDVQAITPTAAPGIIPATTEQTPKKEAIMTPKRKQYTLDSSFFVSRDGFQGDGQIWRYVDNELWVINPVNDLIPESERPSLGNYGIQKEVAIKRLAEMGIDVNALARVPFIADIVQNYINRIKSPNLDTFFSPAGAAKITLPESNNPNRKNATSIAEYFDVNKIKYPNVAERAKLYEQLGLGNATIYAGTFEQNGKLLTELKRLT